MKQVLIGVVVALGVGIVSGIASSVITTFVLEEKISGLDKRIEAERQDRMLQDTYILHRLDGLKK